MTSNCPICLQDMKTKKTLSCSHSFHKNCIDKWFKIKNTCPTCRDQGDRKNLLHVPTGGYDNIYRRRHIDIHEEKTMLITSTHSHGIHRTIIHYVCENDSYRDTLSDLFIHEYRKTIRNWLAIYGVILLCLTLLEYTR